MKGTCRLCNTLFVAAPNQIVGLAETPELRIAREHNDLIQQAAQHLQQHHPEIFRQLVAWSQNFFAAVAGKLLDHTDPEFAEPQRQNLLLVWFLVTSKVSVGQQIDGKAGQLVNSPSA